MATVDGPRSFAVYCCSMLNDQLLLRIKFRVGRN